MNDNTRRMVDHAYPFLAEEYEDAVANLSQWFEYEDIVLMLVQRTRQRTPLGSDRYVQMTCLYEWAPLARDIAKLGFRAVEKTCRRLLEGRPA